MEKVLKIIFSTVIVILSFVLQLLVIDNMSLFGVRPNLFLISIIVVCLNTDIYISTFFSFIIGVIVDMLFGAGGLFTISYTIIGMLLGFVNEDYMKENLLSISILTGISTILFELVQYIKSMIVISKYVSIFFFLKQLIISILLNVIIVVIICFIFRKIMKKIYKKQDKLYW